MIRLNRKEDEYCIDQLNPDNFEASYTYYFPKIYNYVRFRVNDPHDTDDLTSKIFERVIANAQRFNSEKRVFFSLDFRHRQ